MTRSLKLALTAAFALFTLSAPMATSAIAQAYGASSGGAQALPNSGEGGGAPVPVLKIEPKNHEQGQKEAPDVAKAAGLTCDITDAYFVGEGMQKDEAGKDVKAKFYEVACKQGLGYVLNVAANSPTPQYFDCILVSANANLHCRLPANVDNKTMIAPVMTAAGKSCTINNVRTMGATKSGDSYFEVGCAGALGFVLHTKKSGEANAIDCEQTLTSNLKCQFTTKEQIEGALAGVVDALVAKSGKQCQITGRRAVGSSARTGELYYEVGCSSGQGFMIVADKSGTYERAISCANATGIGGGCTMTDSTVAESSESGTYTKLASAAGFTCDVAKYRYIGTDKDNNEVVELQCKNRADGGMGMFPANNSRGKVYDCVQAGALGQKCQLTDASAVFSKYTAALASRGKRTCTVSNARWLGHYSESNTDLIETACSDGLPGWVVEVGTDGPARNVMTCGEAKAAGSACQLPGNVK